MIISEITINELREIETIKLKVNDSLVDYLSKEEGAPVNGNAIKLSWQPQRIEYVEIHALLFFYKKFQNSIDKS
jgi:hypothetical protein